MPGIDESRPFVPLKIAVLTVSDTRTRENDTSGDALERMLVRDGHQLVDRRIRTDDQAVIERQLQEWIDDPGVEVVLSTGGTGLTGRDVTPEAFAAVCSKEIPGFGELFRMLSYEKIGTSTIQSRAVGGVAKRTLLFALPGSTGACKDGWEMILRHQLDVRYRPCNFAQILDRLEEGS